MLTVIIPASDEFIEESMTFRSHPEVKLELEHSLISISKWESKFKKPFLADKEKTDEEIIYYIKCMTLNKNVDPEVYNRIPTNIILEIYEYIYDPMTATIVNDNTKGKKNNQFVTSELIYCWMVMAQIPSSYEKWHLNRLMTLIKVYGIESGDKKKMSKSEVNKYHRNTNLERRAKWKQQHPNS